MTINHSIFCTSYLTLHCKVVQSFEGPILFWYHEFKTIWFPHFTVLNVPKQKTNKQKKQVCNHNLTQSCTDFKIITNVLTCVQWLFSFSTVWRLIKKIIIIIFLPWYQKSYWVSYFVLILYWTLKFLVIVTTLLHTIIINH